MAGAGDSRSLTTLRVLLAGAAIVAIGLLLLYVAGRDDWMAGRDGLQSVLDDLGGVLIASVALGLLWELVGKRSFAREVLGTARVSTDAVAAGLVSVGTNYLQDPDWAELFRDVSKLDIFLAYGRTWRNSNNAHLGSLASRRGARIRVYLPDPNDPDTINRLADRFQMGAAQLKDAIEESRQYFANLKSGAKATIQVFYRGGDSTFSCYRFDGTAIVTLYTHSKQRTQVPTIVCREGGSLYEFVRAEFRAIESQSQQVE